MLLNLNLQWCPESHTFLQWPCIEHICVGIAMLFIRIKHSARYGHALTREWAQELKLTTWMVLFTTRCPVLDTGKQTWGTTVSRVMCYSHTVVSRYCDNICNETKVFISLLSCVHYPDPTAHAVISSTELTKRTISRHT